MKENTLSAETGTAQASRGDYLFPINPKYPQTADNLWHEYLIAWINSKGRECSASYTDESKTLAKLQALRNLGVKIIKTETRFFAGFVSL